MTYQERKEAGRCTTPYCKRRCSGGTQLCHGHRRAAAVARQRYNRRRRKNRKVCIDCPRKAKDGRHCLRCRAMRTARRSRKTRVGDKVGDKRSAIERRTAVDNFGRVRYHGQERRGQQPRAQLDQKDIKDAIAALVQVEAALAQVRDPSNADIPRLQRKEAESAVLAVGALGCRLYGNVLLRNGCDPEMLVTARDDEG